MHSVVFSSKPPGGLEKNILGAIHIIYTNNSHQFREKQGFLGIRQLNEKLTKLFFLWI